MKSLKTQPLVQKQEDPNSVQNAIRSKIESEMKIVIEQIEDRLNKFVVFKDAVSKELLLVCKGVDKLNTMFKKFEFENQPLIKDLVVF